MTLDTHFSDDKIEPIQDGIRTFMQLIGLFADPLQGRFIAEEQDLIAALVTMKTAFAATEVMLGKRKYQGVDFNACEQVYNDMTTFLLTGDDELELAYERKRHLPMFYLVLEPTINLFSAFDHQEILDLYEEVIDSVIEMVRECTDYGTKDDAIAAQARVRSVIAAREAVKKAQRDAKTKKRPRKTKKEVLVEMLMGINEDSDE